MSEDSADPVSKKAKLESDTLHTTPLQTPLRDFSGVYFEIVTNDGSDAASEKLITLKNIFSRQLPKMPKEYIVRLVFDRRHISLAICKEGRIIGGICYRPYYEQRFGEIAFCAISANEQVRGFGTHLMNQLKHHVQKDNIEYFLTYADNFAIGYFQKQGFSKSIAMPKERWVGFIKDYDGGTLMECYIHPGVNYQRVGAVVACQRSFICERVQERSQATLTFSGLELFRDGKRLSSALDAPGVRAAGWTPLSVLGTAVSSSERDRNMNQARLCSQLKMHLDKVRIGEHAWAFDSDTPVVPGSGGGAGRGRSSDKHASAKQLAAYQNHTEAELLADPTVGSGQGWNLALVAARLRLGDYYRSQHMMVADLARMIVARRTLSGNDPQVLAACVGMEAVLVEVFGEAGAVAASRIASASASGSSDPSSNASASVVTVPEVSTVGSS